MTTTQNQPTPPETKHVSQVIAGAENLVRAAAEELRAAALAIEEFALVDTARSDADRVALLEIHEAVRQLSGTLVTVGCARMRAVESDVRVVLEASSSARELVQRAHELRDAKNAQEGSDVR